MNTFIFVLYIGLILFVSYLFRSKLSAAGGTESYLLSNRSLTTSDIAFSAMAGALTAAGVLFAFGSVVAFGPAGYGILIAFFATIALLAFFAPRMVALAREHNILTLTDFFAHRFGKKTGLVYGLVSSLFMFSLVIGSFSINITILEHFLGLQTIAATILSFGIVIIYLLLGGFKAVVKTDKLQFLVMLLFGLLVVAFVREPVSFSATIDIPAWFSGAFLLLAPVFFFGNIANPTFWQPIIAAKDGKSARKGLLLAALLGAFFNLPMVWLAFTFAGAFPGANPNLALFESVGVLLPEFLAPIIMVGLYATMMSTLDTSLFYTASNVVRNLIPQTWVKGRDVFFTKVGILVIALVSTLTALLIDGFIEFIIATFPIIGITAAPLFVGMYTKVRDSITAAGMVLGLLTFLYLFLIAPPENYLWNMLPALITTAVMVVGVSCKKE